MKKLLLTILLATGLADAVLACGSDKEEKANHRAAREKQIEIYVGAALTAIYGEPDQVRVTAITRECRPAAYIHRSLRKSLFFSPDNKRLLARIDLVDPSELSGKMSRKLAREYKGYQIAQVIKYQDGETMYFVSLKKGREEILVFMPLSI